MLHPLDDPRYQPKHPPTLEGGIPDVVAKWGAPSQLRWFRRFLPELAPRRREAWERYFIHSEHHRGACCPSCLDEIDEGYSDYPYAGHCCCRTWKPADPLADLS